MQLQQLALQGSFVIFPSCLVFHKCFNHTSNSLIPNLKCAMSHAQNFGEGKLEGLQTKWVLGKNSSHFYVLITWWEKWKTNFIGYEVLTLIKTPKYFKFHLLNLLLWMQPFLYEVLWSKLFTIPDQDLLIFQVLGSQHQQLNTSSRW